MSDKPYLKISAGFYLKNKPKGIPGIYQETWTFGTKPSSFSQLMSGLVYQALKFYISAIDVPVEEINAELQKLSANIGNLKVNGSPTPDAPDKGNHTAKRE